MPTREGNVTTGSNVFLPSMSRKRARTGPSCVFVCVVCGERFAPHFFFCTHHTERQVTTETRRGNERRKRTTPARTPAERTKKTPRFCWRRDALRPKKSCLHSKSTGVSAVVVSACGVVVFAVAVFGSIVSLGPLAPNRSTVFLLLFFLCLWSRAELGVQQQISNIRKTTTTTTTTTNHSTTTTTKKESSN
jgi:hypothetical protein